MDSRRYWRLLNAFHALALVVAVVCASCAEYKQVRERRSFNRALDAAECRQRVEAVAIAAVEREAATRLGGWLISATLGGLSVSLLAVAYGVRRRASGGSRHKKKRGGEDVKPAI